MDTPPATPSATKNDKHHRFPGEIISHAVWLYFRFCLSFRDVEELLCECGVVVTYEAIRKWCGKFGQQYANQLRRRRPRPGDKWHMDEVFRLCRKVAFPAEPWCSSNSNKSATLSVPSRPIAKSP